MTGPLAARVQALERRIAALAASQAGGEQFIPNTYTVDANGNVSVTGINIPAGTSTTPPSQDRIRWLRQSDGAVVAEIIGFSSGGAEVVAVRADALAPGDTSQSLLDVLDDQGTEQGNIVVTQTARGATAQVLLTAAGHTRTAVDQLGRSDFLVLSSTELSTVGTATITWPGGTAFSNTTNVALPGAGGNVFGIATVDGIAGTTDAVVMNIHTRGDGTVDLRGKTAGGGSPAAAASATVDYLLWGS
ncbi:MAG TPA: hypothetical protein VFI54_06260 [Solirubrobacteraceae bacterium]|nr:hypothetical protein [Solirubrobacteraceae bacterium]